MTANLVAFDVNVLGGALLGHGRPCLVVVLAIGIGLRGQRAASRAQQRR
jgi:hypothetical protein